MTGNFWLGVFVGFLITFFLGLVFPLFGHIAGGFVGGLAAGFLVKGRKERGAFAGFLAGISGGMLIAVFALMGFASAGTLAIGGSLIGTVPSLTSLPVAETAVVFAIFGAASSTVGGLLAKMR